MLAGIDAASAAVSGATIGAAESGETDSAGGVAGAAGCNGAVGAEGAASTAAAPDGAGVALGAGSVALCAKAVCTKTKAVRVDVENTREIAVSDVESEIMVRSFARC